MKLSHLIYSSNLHIEIKTSPEFDGKMSWIAKIEDLMLPDGRTFISTYNSGSTIQEAISNLCKALSKFENDEITTE